MLVYAVDPYVRRRLDDNLLWTYTSKGDLMLVYAVDPYVKRRLDAGRSICCGSIGPKET